MELKERVRKLFTLAEGISVKDVSSILEVTRGTVLSALGVHFIVSWGRIIQHPVFRALEEHVHETPVSVQSVSDSSDIDIEKILDWLSIAWTVNDLVGITSKFRLEDLDIGPHVSREQL